MGLATSLLEECLHHSALFLLPWTKSCEVCQANYFCCFGVRDLFDCFWHPRGPDWLMVVLLFSFHGHAQLPFSRCQAQALKWSVRSLCICLVVYMLVFGPLCIACQYSPSSFSAVGSPIFRHWLVNLVIMKPKAVGIQRGLSSTSKVLYLIFTVKAQSSSSQQGGT